MVPLKTMTFAVVHMVVAFTVVYVMTGNPFLGGAVALIEPMFNTVAYFFHERVWERFGHRFRPGPGPGPAPARARPDADRMLTAT